MGREGRKFSWINQKHLFALCLDTWYLHLALFKVSQKLQLPECELNPDNWGKAHSWICRFGWFVPICCVFKWLFLKQTHCNMRTKHHLFLRKHSDYKHKSLRWVKQGNLNVNAQTLINKSPSNTPDSSETLNTPKQYCSFKCTPHLLLFRAVHCSEIPEYSLEQRLGFDWPSIRNECRVSISLKSLLIYLEFNHAYFSLVHTFNFPSSPISSSKPLCP